MNLGIVGLGDLASNGIGCLYNNNNPVQNFSINGLIPNNISNLNNNVEQINNCLPIQNYIEAEPVIINQDIIVPTPVVFKKVLVPKPYLPYSKWYKNGFPRFY
ncbi:unnamed protein product [Brachionus calyciflorus]|uniref:Uncharacterized protein n=1 Tax=Brachionus calyciflorus TaxID=104777 RepID=A0A813Q4D2_9BILA|nr:unnamed protein product [Brachionus calyciflorus]